VSGEEAARLIGHQFARPALLIEALTHPGALPKQSARRSRRRSVAPRGNYERLEFLGDRVVGLVIAELLWRRFPREPEGDLTRRLVHLVRREALARVALAIGLDRDLTLSPADALAGAARNPAILADVCEAVIAAIYLDAGFDKAAAFIAKWWEPLVAEMEEPPRDPKTSLQEWAQARGLERPSYDLVETAGPDHAPRFTVAARVPGYEPATATASSKRAAETKAAALLLTRVENG
jgi:ribonuclease-3